MQTHDLLPTPRSLQLGGANLPCPRVLELRARGPAADLEPALSRLERTAAKLGLSCERSPAPAGGFPVHLELDPAPASREAYELQLNRDGARITARCRSGLHAGACTLGQILQNAARNRAALSEVRIEDAADFPVRGVMLDVSRGRVPRMDDLCELVELLSSWKINLVQLYMEHTFAYRRHPDVWADASPFTPEEIRTLDRFARERCVRLVPNQQSFGHFHRWLSLPAYRHLAECPEGVDHPFSREKEPFSLAATDPRCLELLGELYDELFESFSERTLHTGLDETFDLGWGRSKAACEERGKGRVFMDYFLAVHRLVRERGADMQFWADVLLEHPERIAELPADTLACLWGYEAGHPFGDGARLLSAREVPFYLCPGTSSWQSLAGRTGNMVANVSECVQAALGSNAAGLMITDWGDRGHLQAPPASFAAWTLFADLSWNAPRPQGRGVPSLDELADSLDTHAFDDGAHAFGRATLELGSVGERSGASMANASVLFRLLFGDERGEPRRLGLTLEGLEAAGRCLVEARDVAARARPGILEADLVRGEWDWAADLLETSIEFGRGLLGARPAFDVGARLAASIEEHGPLWRRRSRPGGERESLAWLHEAQRVVAARLGP